MSARPRARAAARLAALARNARSRLRHCGWRAALALLLVVGLGGWTSVSAGARAIASDESGAAQGESSSTSGCPSANPPNELTLLAGTPQTTTLDTAFASGLQVALTNSDGCTVTNAAGVPVTFSAPAAGASGVFSASDSNTASVGADASGTATAPSFTANDVSGSYIVTASSQYGSVSFTLTNTATGVPARLIAVPLEHRSARVAGRYPQPLQVRMLDASGNAVAGTAVTFTLGSASACGAGAASASFAGGGTQVTATTDASGLATSPAFTANTAAGSFTATASLSSGAGGGSESVARAVGPSVTPVSFSLENRAGNPVKLTPGVGSTQSTPAGSAFAIRLAVTVTDAHKNLVPGALITFSAPTAGASGRFSVASHDFHHRRVAHRDTVKVKTNACGIAVAPAFTADRTQGGYIVKASAEHARPAAFALVNAAPGQP